MSDDVINAMREQYKLFSKISKQLDQLIEQTAPAGPDYREPLAVFKTYNWASIEAEVIDTDKYGPSAVRWRRQVYTRRAGDGKFGKAIWFSRSIGKQDGENVYVRLITFKGDGKFEAEPVNF